MLQRSKALKLRTDPSEPISRDPTAFGGSVETDPSPCQRVASATGAPAGDNGTRLCHETFYLLRRRCSLIHSVTSNHHNISVGKYLVSPLAKQLDDGRYSASVSIRSGRGSASTDRVMRLEGQFDSAGAARRYAREQGLHWVSRRAQDGCARPHAAQTPAIA